MFWDIFRHRFNFFDNLKFLAYFRQESASAIACLSRKAASGHRRNGAVDIPLGRIYIVSSEVVADNHHRSGNKGWQGQQSHVVWAIHLPRMRIAVATPTSQTRQR